MRFSFLKYDVRFILLGILNDKTNNIRLKRYFSSQAQSSQNQLNCGKIKYLKIRTAHQLVIRTFCNLDLHRVF